MESHEVIAGVRGLEPGQAFYVGRWIIVHTHDGRWVGARESCDEIMPRFFADVYEACTKAEQWLREKPVGHRGDCVRALPGDADVIDWMQRVMWSG